ncbi:MAG: hypothetical protein IT337_02765 [Thermomicrobiales bacterium]|nr:hypothetical protein [Thermomicrobiales bacterium]
MDDESDRPGDERDGASAEPRPIEIAPSRGAIDAARRVGESFLIAIVTSTGLYLIGWVYTASYYQRLSIEPTALDFAPPYVALQAVHALSGLLQYPSILLLLWFLYHLLVRPLRRVLGRAATARLRNLRLLPVVGNLILISPLLVQAYLARSREVTINPISVMGEIASMLENAAVVLLVYAIWLGWGQRTTLVAAVRARRVLPIALMSLVYLLAALSSTSEAADTAAVMLVTGQADNSLEVTIALRDGVEPAWGDRELILVTVRQATYFVVGREPFPPELRPTSWMVPAASVQSAQVRRLNDADRTVTEMVEDGA